MVDVAKTAANGTAPGRKVHFRCPGCDLVHGVTVEVPSGWEWNGSLERPTFTPSVLVTWSMGNGRRADDPEYAQTDHRCHSFVTDRRIQFLGDCTHALANQTVDLPPWQADSDSEETL